MAGSDESGNGLSVQFVPSLNDILPFVVEFLNDRSDRDLFETDHIIVPTVGVRAWLRQQIALRVGVGGPDRTDGVAANISIGFPGALDSLLGRGWWQVDPWDVEDLTMHVLRVISVSDPLYDAHVARLGGGLRAARAIADLFDRYNARRPSMIREWEAGNAVLSPEVGTEVAAGEHTVVMPPIDPADVWQWHVWRRVREEIGTPPWPVRVRQIGADVQSLRDSLQLPSRLLVAGLQTLSVRHIEVLTTLARVIPIHIVMVHPSPELARTWDAMCQAVPLSPGIAPSRPADEQIDESVDELVGSWLRGSRETQMVLASQGVTTILAPSSTPRSDDALLGRVTNSVLTGVASPGAHSPADMSVRIHRAHNLSRQVEVLRDALLHAFHDIPDLQPHDVVILCADIEAAAPLIQSAFAKSFPVGAGRVSLPVVVADRGLRHVDDGAQLLNDLLRTVRGRFGIADVLAIATSPIVMKNFGTGADDVSVWMRVIENATVTWGIDGDHRIRHGLGVHVGAHTWGSALERALLGAALADGEPGPELGNVVPLAEVDSADIDALSVLTRIIAVLAELEEKTSHFSKNGDGATISDWGDAVENALTSLCDPTGGDLDNALESIHAMRGSIPQSEDTIPVRFDHYATLLGDSLSQAPGRQPMRTGAITATSMVPLRGVPFRVVCLVGLDEGTLASGETEGDDLSTRQAFAGDPEPRLDQRRAILDSVCAASDRVIITCNGRSIRDNTSLKLITPLAEFVDLCVRCGVDRLPPDHETTSIEHSHPRHFSSPRNFQAGDVVPDIVWSHDVSALQSLHRSTPMSGPKSDSTPNVQDRVTLDRLRRFVDDPLRTFLQEGLDVSTYVPDAGDESAVIPLSVTKTQVMELTQDLFAARRSGFADAQWTTVQETTGNLPVGHFKTAVLSTVVGRVDSLRSLADAWGIDTLRDDTMDVEIDTGHGVIVGSVAVQWAENGRVVLNPFLRRGRQVEPEQAATTLLVLRAAGVLFDGSFVLSVHKDDDKCQVRFVDLHESIDKARAIDKLARILQLRSRALTRPFPLFGGTANALIADPAKAVKQFDLAVRADRYPSSGECLLYGPQPVFDAVYPANGAEREFFADYFAAVPVRDEATGKELDKQQGRIAPVTKGPKPIQRYVFG